MSVQIPGRASKPRSSVLLPLALAIVTGCPVEPAGAAEVTTLPSGDQDRREDPVAQGPVQAGTPEVTALEVPLPERFGLKPLGVAAISSFGWPLGLGHALVGEWPRGMLWGGLGVGMIASAVPIYGSFFVSSGFARRQLGWSSLLGGLVLPAADAWSLATEARKGEARRAIAAMNLPEDRKVLLADAVVKVPEDALVASLYTTLFTFFTNGTERDDLYGYSFLTGVPGWTISQLAYRPLAEALPIALLQAGLWTAGVHAKAIEHPGQTALLLIPAVYSAWEAWHHTAEARDAGIKAALAPAPVPAPAGD